MKYSPPGMSNGWMDCSVGWMGCAVALIIILAGWTAPRAGFAQAAEPGSEIVPPGTISSEGFFPISVWYSGGNARAPMLSEITPTSREEWREDLQQIKDLGYNTVRTWVEWAKSEPREGEYDFENLDLLMELAQEAGLRVFIQLYLDSAPDWIGKKYPDSYFTNQSGEQMKPQSAPGYTIDHPGVRQAAAAFMTHAAEVAAKYPALFGWDVWSEPHLLNWASAPWMDNAQFGFNPHTQARFREWLKQKYNNDLEALNKAWYRTLLDWEDVEAPRLRTILSFSDYIDWKLFLYDKMKEDVRFRYDTIRKVDDRGIITSHTSPVSLYSSPFSGRTANDDFLIAPQLDYYGMSLYPKHNDPSRHYETWQIRTLADFAHSANKPHGGFQVGEFQSGQGTIGLTISDPVTPADQREWLWSVVALGAKGVHIYAYKPMSSGYESGGFGLTNVDGTIPERARTTGEIARLIDEHRDLFSKSYPIDAEVALVYNPLAQMAGGLSSSNPAAGMHTNSLIGYYRFFASQNIPVEFIHRMHLEDGDLDQYRLIIVPMSLLFTEAAAEGLMAYVSGGGHVLGEARMAWNDERGFASNSLPGMGLTELFGVREVVIAKSDEGIPIQIAGGGIEMGKADDGMEMGDAGGGMEMGDAGGGIEMGDSEAGVSDGGIGAASALQAGDDLVGAYFMESLEPLPGSEGQVDIVATFADGSPAVTRFDYGEGEAMFVGSFLGLASQTIDGAAESNDPFLEQVTEWAGVRRPLTAEGVAGRETLTARLQTHPESGDYVLFLINHEDAEQAISVALDSEYLEIGASDLLLTELISGRQEERSASTDPVMIEAQLPAKQVEVWRIQKR